MEEMAALAIDAVFPGCDRETLERIADDVMGFLLTQDQIQDPSVAINIANNSMEAEMLLPGVTDIEAARAIGEPIFMAAMEHAHVKMELSADSTTMELVPA